jgi:hypothetical protein
MNARSRGALKSQSRKMFPRSYRLSLSKTWSQARAFTHVLIVVLAASPDFMLLFLSDLLGASTSVFCASSTLCQTPIGTKRIPLFCVACQKPLWAILEDNRLKNVQRRNMQMSLGQTCVYRYPPKFWPSYRYPDKWEKLSGYRYIQVDIHTAT